MHLAAAFHETLSFVEIVLRNALDPQLQTWNQAMIGTTNWTKHPATPLDKIVTPKKANELQNLADQARRRRSPNHPRKNAGIDHNDRLANTTFGLWRRIFPDPHQKNTSGYATASTLWTDALMNAFPNLSQDPYGHATGDRVRRLHALRNRVAHMENLLDVDIHARLRDALQLVNAIAPDFRDSLQQSTRVPSVASMRPNP
ncbi:hypothetical protein MYK68_00215 [Gordonia sp. PP30]|uniref:hypothetical protein n=1 Tax=Gordonia sp. PP30 TaxID=2935861 RepID=UPI001FFFAD02|nr:hypothetical protein [Gordonia sp. PP30]UQE75113.1 hypothetical protein MYK68_00215 [Gordonia sp. PP30]